MWMYTKNGQIFGPVSFEEIVNQINAGVINFKTAVYRSGEKIYWAGEHPELKEYFTNAPQADQAPSPKPVPAPAAKAAPKAAPKPVPAPAPVSDLKGEMIASLNKEVAEAFAKKDYAKAIADLESILELDPSQTDAKTMLDVCKKKLDADGKDDKKTPASKKSPAAKKSPVAKMSPAPVAPASVDQLKAGDRDVVTVKGVEFAFRWCPPGTFIMGSPESEEGHRDNQTQHQVTLTKGFWMMETEVTQKQWQAITGNNPSAFKGDKLPVEYVSWYDCQEFCRKCAMLGLLVQLPTEAQWEYACRAGTTGSYAGDLDEMAWYDCGGTYPVGLKKPNAWGLYDMHGNVWEWCQDAYEKYSAKSVTDPRGPASGSSRVIRGGGWSYGARDCRSACRDSYGPDDRSGDLGFRVLRGQ